MSGENPPKPNERKSRLPQTICRFHQRVRAGRGNSAASSQPTSRSLTQALPGLGALSPSQVVRKNWWGSGARSRSSIDLGAELAAYSHRLQVRGHVGARQPNGDIAVVEAGADAAIVEPEVQAVARVDQETDGLLVRVQRSVRVYMSDLVVIGWAELPGLAHARSFAADRRPRRCRRRR